MKDLTTRRISKLNPNLIDLIEYIPCDGGLFEITSMFHSIHLKQFSYNNPLLGCLHIGPTIHLEALSYDCRKKKPVVGDSQIRLVSYGLEFTSERLHPEKLSKIVIENRGLVDLLGSIIEVDSNLDWDLVDNPFYLVKRPKNLNYFDLLMNPTHPLTREIIDNELMISPKPIIIDD